MFGVMQNCEPVRVEFKIVPNSKLLSQFKTIGDLKKKYNSLEFVKYIYIDPADNKLKGVNPPKETPLVANSYITISGDLKAITEFSKLATLPTSK